VGDEFPAQEKTAAPGATTLTLNGAGTYIFLVGSSITAGVGSNIVLENGANPCNVFWRVHASPTLNGTHFAGTGIVGSPVTVGATDILIGRAVALTGAVTMPGNGGTTIGGCRGAVQPPGGVARSKAFLPTTINPGGASTLTMTLSNANATDTLLPSALTDTVLGGVVIALGD
jgi:Ice-binding-like